VMRLQAKYSLVKSNFTINFPSKLKKLKSHNCDVVTLLDYPYIQIKTCFGWGKKKIYCSHHVSFGLFNHLTEFTALI
jgi:hypothetical protein